MARGRALVTDAGERVGLHVIRGLGRAGIRVVSTEVDHRARIYPSLASRYADEAHLLSLVEKTDIAYEEQLLQLGNEGDVLVPVCLNSLLRIVERRELLSTRFHALLPSRRMLLQANDKWSLHQLALSIGVEVPRSWCPRDEDELRELCGQVALPVMIKFRHDRRMYLGPALRYRKLDEVGEVMQAWRHFHEMQPRPIIQEYIVGDGYGFEALYDEGHRCVASFQHRRLVECPPQGGPSAVCESVRVPELEEYGRRLLDELKWTGVAMVEFRRCSETGQFYLLEINPRFWGSIALSEAAGVNFPALYYRCARGEKVETPSYREGVRLRLMPTYLLSGAMSLRNGPRGILKAFSNLRYLFDPRVREGLLTLDDPGGSWAYIRKNLRRGDRGDG